MKKIQVGIKIKLLLMFVISSYLLGCTNYTKQGDLAFAKENWQKAIANYNIAMGESSDATEITYLKRQVKKSKHQLSDDSFNTSKSLANSNNYEDAYTEAIKANKYFPQEKIKKFSLELQEKLFAKYIQKGKINIQQKELDTAISNLQLALNYKPSSEIESLLAETKRRRKDELFKIYTEKGKAALENQNYNDAVNQLRKAQSYGNSKEITQLFEEANRKKNEKQYAKLVGDGEIALQIGNLNESIEKLQAAKEYKNSEHVDLLLSKAREKQEKNYVGIIENVNANIKKHDWEKAKNIFLNIKRLYPQQYKDDKNIKNKNQFVAIMLEGQIAEYNDEQTKARNLYKEALIYNFETAYVQKKYQRLGSYDYKITIHGAVILPWKPSSRKNWDGVSDNIVDSNIANQFFNKVTKLSGPGAFIATEISKEVFKLANSARNSPDCFLEVFFDDEDHGGEIYKDQDEYEPQWDLSFLVKDSNPTDQRILTINVIDKDLFENDNVGAAQLVIGELLEKEGVHYALGMKDGKLRYGAILTLKISVEKINY